MTIAASGNYAKTLDNGRNILAGSATFRSLMGVTTAAEAKAKIWWEITDDVNQYMQSQMPRAIVQYGDGYRVARGSTSSWRSSGPIQCAIEVAIPAEYVDNLQDGGMWFSNQISAVIDEIKTLSVSKVEDTLNAGNTYLNVKEIAIHFAGRGDPELNPAGVAFFLAAITFEWDGI